MNLKKLAFVLPALMVWATCQGQAYQNTCLQLRCKPADSSITLYWDTTYSIYDFKSYNIYKQQASPYQALNFQLETSIASHKVDSYKVTGLLPGNTYYFYLAVEDTFANEYCRTRLHNCYTSDQQVVPSPRNLNAISGSFGHYLEWNRADTNRVARYIVYADTLPNPYTVLDSTFSASDTSVMFTQLDTQQTYFFRVTARDTNGTESGFSNEIAAFYSGTQFPGPGNFNVSYQNGIRGSWDPVPTTFPDHFRYLVYRGNYPGNLQPYYYAGDPLIRTDTAVALPATSNGTKFYYAVKAETFTGFQTQLSNVDSFVYIDTVPPMQPSLKEATGGDATAFLRWNKVDNPSKDFLRYQVFMDTVPAPTTVETYAYGVGDTTVNITGIQNGVQYYFRIRAEDKNGNVSSYSNELSASASDTTGPYPVTNLTAPIDSEVVNLSWSQTPNFDGDFKQYLLFKGTAPSAMTAIDSFSNVTANTYTDVNVTNNNTYYYKVVPEDTLGNRATNPDILKITPTRVERELNNLSSNANLLDSAKVGKVINSVDEDFYKFTITQPTQVTIRTDSVHYLDPKVGNHLSDTYLELFDTTGNNTIDFNDDDPSNGNYSRIVQTLNAAGTYYVKVSNNFTSLTGYYQIHITKLEPDAYEPNNTISQASFLADTQVVNQLSIFPLNDVDIFGFSTETNAKATVEYQNQFYTGTIRFKNQLNQTLQTHVANSATFVVPDTGNYYVSYEIPGYQLPSYTMDFKIIPPISYTDSFAISEIHYRNSALQFVEIYNKHYLSVDVTGFAFQELNFGFPAGYRFPPQDYIVIASDSASFFNEYGFFPDFTWNNDTLNHSTQTITLNDSSNALVDYVTYRNGQNSFPLLTGNTNTIELVNNGLNNNFGYNWQKSHFTGGTPGHPSSKQRNYQSDNFEPNDSISGAHTLFYQDSLHITLSELEDTADYFLIRPRAFDTLTFHFFQADSNLYPELAILNNNGAVVQEDSLWQGRQVTFIPSAEDTFYLQFGLKEDGQQFIVNEGGLQFTITNREKISASPWIEKFEQAPVSLYPPGYRVYDLDNNGQAWEVSFLPIGLNNSAGLSLSSNAQGNDDWIITPPTAIRQDDIFSFYGKPSSSSIPEKVEVWIGGRNSVSPSGFTTLIDSFTIDSSGFKKYEIDMTAYEGQVVRFAIRGVSVNKNILYVDNVSLSPPVYNASVRGYITDYQTGAPVAGVQVSDGQSTAQADSAGYYELNKVSYGLVDIDYEKAGYTSARHTFSLSQGDTVNFNIQLAQTYLDTFYYNPFDSNLTQGYTQTFQGNKSWYVTDTIVYNTQVVSAYQGDSMVVYGGQLGYGPDEVSLYTLKSGSGFDLTQYKTIDMRFALNHHIDTSDGLFMLGNGSFLINTNGDGNIDSLDRFSGNSAGWQTHHVDLTYLNNLNDVDISFAFISGPNFTNGFGAAIDNIYLVGESELPKPPPANVYAQSYLVDTVLVTWQSDTAATDHYKVFRKTLNGNYQLYATTTDTFFTDTGVVNGELYNYYVIATYPFGESDPSGNALATPGIPSTYQVPYTHNFNNSFSDTLPQNWGYDLSVNNPWLVGDTTDANVFNTQFSGGSRFVYGNFFSFGVIGVNYESILTTPWFDCSSVNNQVVLGFDKQGANLDEEHILVYKDALGAQWKTLDTLKGSWNWKRYKYDITALAKGKPYFQAGFFYTNDTNNLNTPNTGFAIDNFRIQDVVTGYIDGTVTSQTGNPLPGIQVVVEATNGQEWTFPKKFVLQTDSAGYYKTPVDSIYDGNNYTIQTWAWKHDSGVVNGVNLNGASSRTENITLNIDLSPPQITAITNDSLGYPKITWQPPKRLGELSYDNGQYAFSDSLLHNEAGGALFSTDAPMPATINQIALYTRGDSTGNGFVLRAFSANASGLPNTSDTIFEKTGLNTATGGYGWYFIDVNKQVDTSHFYLLLYGESGSGRPQKIGYSSNLGQTNSLWKDPASSVFYTRSDAILLRAYLSVGNTYFNYSSVNFPGTYDLFRQKTTDPNPAIIQSGLAQQTYVDTSLNIGDTAVYYLTATSQYGTSGTSNLVGFAMQGLPYAQLTAPNLDRHIIYQDSTATQVFSLENVGLDTLQYNTTFHTGFTEAHVVDTPQVQLNGIEGSALHCFGNPALGDTLTLRFYLENRNLIGDNHNELEVFFPTGTHVMSSTNLQVFNSSRYLLSNGVVGDSVTLRWTDPNAGPSGEVHPFEAAEFEVQVYVDSTANLPVKLDYKITGDSKKTKEDTLQLSPLPFVTSITNKNGDLPAGNFISISSDVSVYQSPLNGARFPCYYKVTTNDQNNAEVILPFILTFDPARGVFRGLVTDDVNNDPVPNTHVSVNQFSDTTDQAGWFVIPDMPVGTYNFTGTNEFYHSGTGTGTLLNHNDTATVLITLSPKIPEPENLKASGEIDAIRLDWNLADYSLEYNMEQPPGNLATEVEDWATIDNDGDGVSWEYYSAGVYEGSYCIANTANSASQNSDWLVSKHLRVEEQNATFDFYAAPQDANFSQERFIVWISTTGDSIVDFTDSLFSYQFPSGNNAWQNFSVPLQNYVGDSIYVAVECVSNNQFKLKLDAISFRSVRYTSEPIDTGVYTFKVYRSKSNGPFSMLDSLSFANDTVTYSDTTAIKDTLYTYYVRSVVPQINQISEQSNLASFRLLSQDLGVTKINKPITGRYLTNNEQVEIEVTNLGTDSIFPTDTFTVGYRLDGGPVSTQQHVPDTVYAPQQTFKVAFNDSADLSAVKTYQLKAWTQLGRDNNHFNDTLIRSIQHKPDTLLPPNWSVDPFNFQYNMSLTAEISILGTFTTDTNDLLGAFVNNQVRGVSFVNYIPAFNVYVAQITVYSNVSIENITFKVWDASEDSIFDIIESYTFINNQIYGSLTNPEQLHTSSSTQFYDVAVTGHTAPDPANNTFSNNESVSIELTNQGSIDFAAGDSIEVGYQAVRKGITVSSAVEQLHLSTDFVSGNTRSYTFSKKLNMTDTGSYHFTSYANWFNDYDRSNDTLEQTVVHLPAVNKPNWNVNPANYQYSSFLTAKLFFDDIVSEDESDMVAAFVNNQVRGVAEVEYESAFGIYVVQMAVYSNSTSGEKITFQAFDRSKNQVLHVEETYNFSNNAVWGSLVNPERLHAVTGYNSVKDFGQHSEIRVYPNPSNGLIFIESGHADIYLVVITNAMGQEVFKQQTNSRELEIDLLNAPAGIYQVRILVQDGLVERQIIISE